MSPDLSFWLEWGYWGMFLVAFLSGSIIPLMSEALLVALLQQGCSPLSLLVVATLGNSLGGMSCYGIGWLGKRDWIHRWLGVSNQKLERAYRFLQGGGAWMGFFTFLPWLGDPIAVCLGLMRSNPLITGLSMPLGKALRYLLVLLSYQGVLSLF